MILDLNGKRFEWGDAPPSFTLPPDDRWYRYAVNDGVAFYYREGTARYIGRGCIETLTSWDARTPAGTIICPEPK